MLECSVSKDMKKRVVMKEMTVRKVAAHSCLALIVKELEMSVEHGRMITTLNPIKH